ncbi:hypothetical protein AGMMS50225_20960 [Betaproteobacteria bacterium]|nr:hypothetical protein AGMMS50225_20960 [Betaproteobacteria bacterium]
MNLRITLLIIAMSVPSLAFAQAYKCKLANGAVSFQDHPCAIGSVGTPLTLQPASSPSVEPVNTPTKAAVRPRTKTFVPGGDYQRRLADEQLKAQNEQVIAHNRMLRCDHARQQLGVLKVGRPVYSYNDKGERVYVEDKNRAAQLALAEQRVAEACN